MLWSFKSILVQEDYGKQNSDESYTNKYHKHFACSYVYKLVWVNDNFRKSFKIYLGEDAVYNFINSMIEESKYWSDVMEKCFNKKFVRPKKTMKILRTLLNGGSLTMVILIMVLK